MPRHWRILLCLPLLLCSSSLHAQPAPTGCVAFAADGTLATATIRYGGDIEIKLVRPGAKAIKSHLSVASSTACEIAFSDDGALIATVLLSDALHVVLTDGKSGKTAATFSSPWLSADEPAANRVFLAGFLPDHSLGLRRYLPQSAADNNEHLQIWSGEGKMISDQPRAEADAHPDGHALLAPKPPFLSLTSDDKKAQIAVLSDANGAVLARAALPIPGKISNAPLLGDTVHATTGFQVSSDGQIAVVGRTLYGQIIMATEHDWGSEIEVLTLRPFRQIAARKTGLGGIQALAVDHHNNTIRVVGFWLNKWHDLRWDESHPGTWKKASL